MRIHYLLPAALLLAGAARAEETHFSVTLQNDIFAGSDGGGYTNGIALARIRSVSPGEAAVAPQWLLAPVASWLGVGHATLTLSSLNQMMVTPADLTRKIPDPADSPYMGALWYRAAQVSVQDEVADMLAFNIGVIGPASGARQTQTFIHRITNSEKPEGWDYQVKRRALLGIERYRAIRFTPDNALAGKPSTDFIAMAGASVGNWQSSAGTTLMLRYGTNLKQSYPTVMRIAMRAGDPVVLGRGWFAYTGVHADRMFSQMGIGSNQPVQGSTARLREVQVIGLAGFAYGWGDASLSFSAQNSSSLTTVTGRRKAYGSITYSSLLR
ncbi:lipid A-modifier LpxR family protein [Duganella sp. P38]|uniref:lipid A-modifier LpxR family protein n=1 Tax=Duganella sp. P38 TaxID=3423949 RepID=UPI003D799CA9